MASETSGQGFSLDFRYKELKKKTLKLFVTSAIQEAHWSFRMSVTNELSLVRLSLVGVCLHTMLMVHLTENAKAINTTLQLDIQDVVPHPGLHHVSMIARTVPTSLLCMEL